jgi:hypothetical protein
MLSKNCCTDRRKHSRIAMSAVNIADNATAHMMRKSSIPIMRRRPARATHRTITKAPAMATNAIDVETAVAPRESLACEVAIVGVKGQWLVGMEAIAWPELQGNAQTPRVDKWARQGSYSRSAKVAHYIRKVLQTARHQVVPDHE